MGVVAAVAVAAVGVVAAVAVAADGLLAGRMVFPAFAVVVAAAVAAAVVVLAGSQLAMLLVAVVVVAAFAIVFSVVAADVVNSGFVREYCRLLPLGLVALRRLLQVEQVLHCHLAPVLYPCLGVRQDLQVY